MYTKIRLSHTHKTIWRVGGKSLQLSSQTYFAKIEDKKVIAKNSSKNFTAGVILLLFFIDSQRAM